MPNDERDPVACTPSGSIGESKQHNSLFATTATGFPWVKGTMNADHPVISRRRVLRAVNGSYVIH
jgi:hypothetical protein